MTQKSARAKQPISEADVGSEESVDKIRDILFGSQMRDYERKFSQLEERIMKEVSHLREEQEQRLMALEQSVDRDLASLTKRLDDEHDNRLAAEQDLSEALAANTEQLREALAGLGDNLKQTAGELQKQIEQQSRTLYEEIGSRQTETGNRLDHEAGVLRKQKMDRSALSALFNELATRITDDSLLADGTLQDGGGKA